jgi:hypothetical protein
MVGVSVDVRCVARRRDVHQQSGVSRDCVTGFVIANLDVPPARTMAELERLDQVTTPPRGKI